MNFFKKWLNKLIENYKAKKESKKNNNISDGFILTIFITIIDLLIVMAIISLLIVRVIL